MRSILATWALAIFLTTLSLGATASAQRATERPWRDLVELRIDGFAPADAGPGDRVVIRGRGFTRGAQVFVGGRPSTIESIRRRAIVFVVPRTVGDGRIVLREPRVGDRLVGVLELGPPAPVFTSVDVERGRRGIRIVIEGHGFLATDELMVGEMRAEVRHVTGERIVAQAPREALGSVAIVRPRLGRRYETGAVVRMPGAPEEPRSRWRRWRDDWRGDDVRPHDPVVGPARVGAVHVERARGGSQIVITGRGFGADTQVWVAGGPLQIVALSEDRIVVRVPRGLWGTHTVMLETRGQHLVAPVQVVLPR